MFIAKNKQINYNVTQELDPHRPMKRNLVNMKCDPHRPMRTETQFFEYFFFQKSYKQAKDHRMVKPQPLPGKRLKRPRRQYQTKGNSTDSTDIMDPR